MIDSSSTCLCLECPKRNKDRFSATFSDENMDVVRKMPFSGAFLVSLTSNNYYTIQKSSRLIGKVYLVCPRKPTLVDFCWQVPLTEQSPFLTLANGEVPKRTTTLFTDKNLHHQHVTILWHDLSWCQRYPIFYISPQGTRHRLRLHNGIPLMPEYSSQDPVMDVFWCGIPVE
jgi:hypothetical protein